MINAFDFPAPKSNADENFVISPAISTKDKVGALGEVRDLSTVAVGISMNLKQHEDPYLDALQDAANDNHDDGVSSIKADYADEEAVQARHENETPETPGIELKDALANLELGSSNDGLNKRHKESNANSDIGAASAEGSQLSISIMEIEEDASNCQDREEGSGLEATITTQSGNLSDPCNNRAKSRRDIVVTPPESIQIASRGELVAVPLKGNSTGTINEREEMKESIVVCAEKQDEVHVTKTMIRPASDDKEIRTDGNFVIVVENRNKPIKLKLGPYTPQNEEKENIVLMEKHVDDEPSTGEESLCRKFVIRPAESVGTFRNVDGLTYAIPTESYRDEDDGRSDVVVDDANEVTTNIPVGSRPEVSEETSKVAKVATKISINRDNKREENCLKREFEAVKVEISKGQVVKCASLNTQLRDSAVAREVTVENDDEMVVIEMIRSSNNNS